MLMTSGVDVSLCASDLRGFGSGESLPEVNFELSMDVASVGV